MQKIFKITHAGLPWVAISPVVTPARCGRNAMLRYLGTGQRLYGDRPMPSHKRVNWEFLAVVRGKIAPFTPTAQRPEPVASTFWLFPPGLAHGWAGEPGKKCELIVIHFNSVPTVTAELVAGRGPLSVALNAADRRFLRAAAGKLKRHYWHPIRESEIHTERTLMDLCLLILRECAERRQPLHTGHSLAKVVRAEKWLRDQLADNPAIGDAAREIGLSSSQLNRLFRQVRKRSPQQVLNQLKIERAMELLGNSTAKLHSVAAESGFSSASNLCRAFKGHKGHSPTMWRQETFIQYKTPSKSAKTDHTAHGRRYRAVT